MGTGDLQRGIRPRHRAQAIADELSRGRESLQRRWADEDIEECLE